MRRDRSERISGATRVSESRWFRVDRRSGARANTSVFACRAAAQGAEVHRQTGIRRRNSPLEFKRQVQPLISSGHEIMACRIYGLTGGVCFVCETSSNRCMDGKRKSHTRRLLAKGMANA